MKNIIYSCLLMLSINSILMQTILRDNGVVKNLIRVGVFFLIIFTMIIKNIRLNKKIILLIILSVILLLIGRNMDQFSYIFIFSLSQCLIFLDEQNVIKITFIGSLISFSLIFIFLALGITKNEVLDFRNRMTFGLGVDRIPFFYNVVYGFLSTSYLYFTNKNINKNKFIINFMIIIIGTYFFIKTDVRGGYSCLIILIILTNLLPYIYKNKFIVIILKNLPIIFYILLIVLIYFKNNIQVNDIFSYRPMLIGKFFSNIKIIDLILSKSVKSFDTISIVDNTYAHMLIGGGIILTVAIFILYRRAIENLIKNKKFNIIAFIVSTAIYFNVESIGVRIENMFIILWWYTIIYYGMYRNIKSKVENINEKYNSNCGYL